MNRRLVLTVSAIALAGVAALPATAAPKPKPFTKTYTMTLDPDPSGYLGLDAAPLGTGCGSLIEGTIHRQKITVPAKGSLKVLLESPDPTGQAVTDWDMYILKDDGATAPNTGRPAEEVLDSSHSATSYEATMTKFTKATKVIIEVCNLIGTPDMPGKVIASYKP